MFGLFGDHLKDAKKILKKENVFSAQEIFPKLGISIVPKLSFDYSRDTLKWCAAQNRKGKQWIVFPKIGWSLMDAYAAHPECFGKSSLWDRDNIPRWMFIKSQPGYRLVNISLGSAIMQSKAGLKGMPFLAQTRIETIVEIIIAFRILRNKFLFPSEFYCGEDYNGVTPIVGKNDRRGMLLMILPTAVIEQFAVGDVYGTSVSCVPEPQTKT